VRAPGPETGIVCAPSRGAFLGAAIAAGFAPGSCAAIALPAAAAAGDLFAVEARNEGCAIARAGRLPAAAALLCGARLDLNAATEADLALLPGIGPARARRIAESRRTEGPFPDVGSLDRVPGIGPKTVEQLRPWILIGAPL
jgi:competence protein ComEA